MGELNDDYKLFLDERFKGISTLINSQFIDVHDRLQKIEAQTTKTNGRVNKLEIDNITHPINCPQGPKIEEINKTLADIRFFIKYPKLAVGIASVFIFIFLSSAILFYSGLTSNLKQSKENTELIMKNDTTLKTISDERIIH
jgi:hypothetical protein